MLEQLARLEENLETEERNLIPLQDKETQLRTKVEEIEAQKALLTKKRGSILSDGRDEETLKEIGNQILLMIEDIKTLSDARAELTQQVEAKKEEITRIRGQHQDVKRRLEEEKTRQMVEALKGQGKEAMAILNEIVAKMVSLDKDKGVQYCYWWNQASQIANQIFV